MELAKKAFHPAKGAELPGWAGQARTLASAGWAAADGGAGPGGRWWEEILSVEEWPCVLGFPKHKGKWLCWLMLCELSAGRQSLQVQETGQRPSVNELGDNQETRAPGKDRCQLSPEPQRSSTLGSPGLAQHFSKTHQYDLNNTSNRNQVQKKCELHPPTTAFLMVSTRHDRTMALQ